MKKSSYKKIERKYRALLETIAKELNCVIHSSFAVSEKTKLIDISIKTYDKNP
jgi:hypothetical protein